MSGRLQILVSSVNKDVHELPDKMNIETDAVIVNQLVGTKGESKDETFEAGTKMIRAFIRCEKGVGLSRNTALSKADSELIHFGDDDIIYDKGYSDKIVKEFILAGVQRAGDQQQKRGGKGDDHELVRIGVAQKALLRVLHDGILEC